MDFQDFYALSGYMAAYSWNIMVAGLHSLLFHWIVYGLERLVGEQKGMSSTGDPWASILSTYYVSIMTLPFWCYFIALLIFPKEPGPVENTWRLGARFGIYSPAFRVDSRRRSSPASGDLLPPGARHPATLISQRRGLPILIFDTIARHIGNVGTEIGLDHWPNIYCGVDDGFSFFCCIWHVRRSP